MNHEPVVVRNAEVDGKRVDVAVENGVITEIGASIDQGSDLVIDADGAAMLPGLHDHHVHLLAMAARFNGVDVSGDNTPEMFDQHIMGAAANSNGGWIRVGGHDEHRHGPLTRDRLDVLAPLALVRVQHRSGLAWTLSSGALQQVGIADGGGPEGVELDATGRPSGRLLRMDDWLASRVGVTAPSLDAVGRQLTGYGFTGVTDATYALGSGRTAILRDAVQSGAIRQHLTVLGVNEEQDVKGWAQYGPAKILVDELTEPDPDALAVEILQWHRQGRAVAIHAVSRVETITTATAFALAGTIEGDRMEHGSVLPSDLDELLAATHVTVVLQPALIFERGDHYLSVVDDDDLPFLHRAGSLRAAGVRISAGSDAPVTSCDPWQAIATATSRRSRGGHVLGEAERVSAAIALDWYLTDPMNPGGAPRRLRKGQRADLCLLDRPLAEVLEDPNADNVRLVLIGGRLMGQ